VKSVAISADEELVAFSALGEVVVWNVKDDRVEWSQAVSQSVISALAFSPDGQHLVIGDTGRAGMVFVCDRTGRVVGEYSTRTPVTAIACPTPKQTLIANAEGKELLTLSLPDAQKVSVAPHPAQGNTSIYDRFVFSRNGLRGVWNREQSATIGELKLWKAQ
jgi:hypothetical protein